jgi:hypothetical protein
MLNGREISNYEKGLLTGVAIGAVVGPSITLVVFCLIIAYDLGRPQIIDVGQKAISRIFALKNEKSNPNQFTDALGKLNEMDPDTIQKIFRMGAGLMGENEGVSIEDEKD